MKILFAGTPETAASALRTLLRDPRMDVVGVLTQPDARRGRGRTTHPSPVAELAAEHGVPVHKWPSLSPRDPEVRRVLRAYADDGVSAVAVVAYGSLIPPDLLDCFRHGWVNLHFSLLPRWRGAAPVQSAIAAGDATTGVTIFRIEQGLDTGPIVAQHPHPIGPDTTSGELLDELTQLGAPLLADALTALDSGQIPPQPQEADGVTHAPKIAVADARVDWSQPAHVIHRQARAHTPAPGPWTLLGGERVKLAALSLATANDPAAHGSDSVTPAPLAPGELRFLKTRVEVGTGDIPLVVGKIQPAGKKMMDADAWARGVTLAQGQVLRFDDGATGTAQTEV